MPAVTTFTFDDLAVLIQTTLRNDSTLSYVEDTSIIIHPQSENRDVIPQFKDYLIKIIPPESGFLTKRPRIGSFYRNEYAVVIELWIKSPYSPVNRILQGSVKKNKGIFEFFQDVSNILEHNRFNNQLDPYPGSSISDPIALSNDDKMVTGVGFFWFGNQDNFK